jgi:hypothetical protein
MNLVEKEKGVEILPRIAFKKKYQNINGQDSFEITRLDVSNIHPSYY